MFTWVCPRCGRENSPSYNECPDCKERDAQAGLAAPLPPVVPPQPPSQRDWQAPVQPPYQPPSAPPQQQIPQQQQPAPYATPPYGQPQYAPPQYQQPPDPSHSQPPQYNYPPHQPQQQQYYGQQPPQYAPQPTQYQQPQYAQQPPQYVPPQQQHAAPQAAAPKYTPSAQSAALPPDRPLARPPSGLAALPVWMLMLIFAGAFLALGGAVYYGYQRFGKGGPAGFTGGEQPAAAVAKSKGTSPLQKYIEVVGIRLTSDAKKKPVAKFVVVNHASSEFSNFTATVTLWASTSRSEEDAIGTFTVKVPAIGPNESKELTEAFKTKLKIYELPDWQFATAEVQIISQ